MSARISEFREPPLLRFEWLESPAGGRWLVSADLLPDYEWGQLTYRYENEVLHLLWSGTGLFQLQLSYDGVTWYDEGGCRQGPADMQTEPRKSGGPQFYRVVECQAAPETPGE